MSVGVVCLEEDNRSGNSKRLWRRAVYRKSSARRALDGAGRHVSSACCCHCLSSFHTYVRSYEVCHHRHPDIMLRKSVVNDGQVSDCGMLTAACPDKGL